jgi:tetratricopeptide (TPR) repeat protein
MAKSNSNPTFPTGESKNIATTTISIADFQSFLNALPPENIAHTNNTVYLVHGGQTPPKSSDYQTAAERISSQTLASVALGKPTSSKNMITEALTGHNTGDADIKWILLNSATLSAIQKERFPINNLFELVYIIEKLNVLQATVGLAVTPANNTLSEMFTMRWKLAIKYYVTNNKQMHRWAFMILSLFAFVFMTQMSKTASISGDEFTQYTYSKLIANYYLDPLGMGIPVDTNELKGQRMPTLAKALPEMGSNVATIKDPDRIMHVYGSSFDTFTTILGHCFGVDDYMGFRHWWNAVFGFLAIFYTALIVKQLTKGSWLFAWVSLLVMLFMPRFFGEAMNNPKDVPFALGYVMSLYYALKLFKSGSKPRWNNIVGLVVGTALGISVRIGGLLSVAIFMMYAGLKYIETIGLKPFLSLKWTGFTKLLSLLFGLGIASYILGIFFWPYGWDAPLTNPMEALKEFTNYSVSLRQLFEGKLYDSDMLPLFYLRNYLWITTPLAVMLGIGLFLILLYPNRQKFNNEIFLILFAAVFPVVYIYIQKSQVYGGIRQILFTLPCFVGIAFVGYQWLDHWLTNMNQRLKGFVLSIAIALTVMPAKFVFANHPVSYSYFNEIKGCTKEAYGEYEMDYYLASLRPSTEWFLKNVVEKNPNRKFEVLSYGMDHVKYYCRNHKNVHVGYTRFDDRSAKKWDYCIFYNAYFDKSRLNSGEFPPNGTVYQQLVDGVPAGVVIERPISAPDGSFDDFEGIKAIEKDTAFAKGIELLNRYVKVDPSRSEIYFYLSTAYANLGNISNAIAAAETARKYYPEHSRSCFALHQYYVSQKNYDKAISVMSEFIESRPRDGEGYVMKAQAQLMKGDAMSGLATLQEAVAVNPMDYRVYGLGAQAFQMQKDVTNYNLWVQAAQIGSAKTQIDFQMGVEAIMTIHESITGKPLDVKKYGLEN